MTPGRVGQDVPWGDGDRGFARGVAAALGSPPVASGALTRSGEQRWAVESISGVIINEYSAANCELDGSDCGDYEDWIELYNNSNNAIDLAGYYLSDKIDNITKWQFSSSIVIEPNSYLIIYASGLDPTLETSNTNTSFKLTQTRSSEYIVLADSNEQILDYKKLDRHQLTHSWGRDDDFEWRVYENSTPGGENGSSVAYNNYVDAPMFNIESGFFNSAVEIVLSSNDSDVEIYYTLDGSFPDKSCVQKVLCTTRKEAAFDETATESLGSSRTAILAKAQIRGLHTGGGRNRQVQERFQSVYRQYQ